MKITIAPPYATIATLDAAARAVGYASIGACVGIVSPTARQAETVLDDCYEDGILVRPAHLLVAVVAYAASDLGAVEEDLTSAPAARAAQIRACVESWRVEGAPFSVDAVAALVAGLLKISPAVRATLVFGEPTP